METYTVIHFRKNNSFYDAWTFRMVLGKEIQQILTLYFPWLRKMIGPLLILMGLMLAGIIQGKISSRSNLYENKMKLAHFYSDSSFP